MYFVDKKRIEESLDYLDILVKEVDNHTYNTYIEKLGLERMGHMIIESILDVGNLIIDGFIMRDPGSYEDIIDILIDEQVLPENEGNQYKQIIGLRKMLVKDYLNINHGFVLKTIQENYTCLSLFSERVRSFLDSEQDVATTFTNS